MLFRGLSSERLLISAPAKVNLYLELLGKRDDGFHEIETIMSTVSLFDQLDFTLNRSGQLTLEFQQVDRKSAPLPTGSENLVVKALERLRAATSQATQQKLGMDIKLLKRIPSAAGLGGASSDAAAALVAGNILWNLGLPMEQLASVAAEIGSDVPFFLSGGMAMCRGRGEIIEPLAGPSGLFFVIAKPPVGLSTPRVFKACNLAEDLGARPRSSGPVSAAVTSGQSHRIAKELFNRLQSPAQRLAPEIRQLFEAFETLPCLGHHMSGSGSSYFGLFDNLKVARNAAARLSSRWPALKIHCVRSLNRCPALAA